MRGAWTLGDLGFELCSSSRHHAGRAVVRSQMKPLKTVQDTNVLIAALRSRRGALYEVLRLVAYERWRLKLREIK